MRPIVEQAVPIHYRRLAGVAGAARLEVIHTMKERRTRRWPANAGFFRSRGTRAARWYGWRVRRCYWLLAIIATQMMASTDNAAVAPTMHQTQVLPTTDLKLMVVLLRLRSRPGIGSW